MQWSEYYVWTSPIQIFIFPLYNCSVSSYHNLYVKFKFITLSLDRVFSISIYKGIYNLLKFIHAWLIGIFLVESLLFQVLTSWFFFFLLFILSQRAIWFIPWHKQEHWKLQVEPMSFHNIYFLFPSLVRCFYLPEVHSKCC